MIIMFLSHIVNYISDYIGSIIKGIIIFLIAYPIGFVGYALHKGIRMHRIINKTIKELKRKGESINSGKVNQVRADANKQLFIAYIGMGIMAVSYLLIIIFIPDFFKLSLLAIIPFGLGLSGFFIVPDFEP